MILLHFILFPKGFKKLLILVGLILVIVDMSDSLRALGVAAVDLQDEFKGRQKRVEIVMLCLAVVDVGLYVFWQVEAGEVRELVVVYVSTENFVVWVDCEKGTIDISTGPGGKAEEQTAVNENAETMRQFILYFSLVSGIPEIDNS